MAAKKSYKSVRAKGNQIQGNVAKCRQVKQLKTLEQFEFRHKPKKSGKAPSLFKRAILRKFLDSYTAVKEIIEEKQ